MRTLLCDGVSVAVFWLGSLKCILGIGGLFSPSELRPVPPRCPMKTGPECKHMLG